MVIGAQVYIGHWASSDRAIHAIGMQRALHSQYEETAVLAYPALRASGVVKTVVCDPPAKAACAKATVAACAALLSCKVISAFQRRWTVG